MLTKEIFYFTFSWFVASTGQTTCTAPSPLVQTWTQLLNKKMMQIKETAHSWFLADLFCWFQVNFMLESVYILQCLLKVLNFFILRILSAIWLLLREGDIWIKNSVFRWKFQTPVLISLLIQAKEFISTINKNHAEKHFFDLKACSLLNVMTLLVTYLTFLVV